MPRPYGYYGGHSSFLGGLFAILLMVVLLVGVALAIGWFVRRGRGQPGLE